MVQGYVSLGGLCKNCLFEMHFRIFYKITVNWDFALWSIQGVAWGPVKQALHEVQLRGKHSPLSPPQTTQSIP